MPPTPITAIVAPYLGAAFVGGVVGAVAMSVVLRPAPPPPSEPPAAPLASICEVEPESLEPLRERAEDAELHARVLRGQIALIGGIPEPWPDGTDIEAERARVLAAAQAELDRAFPEPALPYDLRANCDEDPCIVQLLVGPASDEDSLLDARPPHTTFQELPELAGNGRVMAPRRDEVGHWYVITLHPPAGRDDPARVERIRVRVERVHREGSR